MAGLTCFLLVQWFFYSIPPPSLQEEACKCRVGFFFPGFLFSKPRHCLVPVSWPPDLFTIGINKKRTCTLISAALPEKARRQAELEERSCGHCRSWLYLLSGFLPKQYLLLDLSLFCILKIFSTTPFPFQVIFCTALWEPVPHAGQHVCVSTCMPGSTLPPRAAQSLPNTF